MTRFIDRLKSLFGYGGAALDAVPPNDPLDYELVITLDAENLAEQGILTAYKGLSARLERYSPSPLEVTEVIDNDGLGYSVYAGERQYVIWEVIDGVQNTDGWERATVAFFQIINARLARSSHHFYALYGGNDLFGIFLTEEEFAAARKAIAKRSNWPWMPDDEQPHYGFPVENAVF